MSWTSLPAEIRHLIFEELIRKGNVAYCASVCREWQAAIEKHNFSSLHITVDDIPTFKQTAPRTSSLIQYVWYSIELLDYYIDEYDSDDSGYDAEINQEIVEDCFRALFCALSK